jgi:hypothetical protein
MILGYVDTAPFPKKQQMPRGPYFYVPATAFQSVNLRAVESPLIQSTSHHNQRQFCEDTDELIASEPWNTAIDKRPTVLPGIMSGHYGPRRSN